MSGTETGAATGAQEAAEPEVIVTRRGRLGHLRLNRPKALNALTHAMVLEIDRALQEWAEDPEVRGVLIDGAGTKGLCAGGDVVSLREALVAGQYAEAAEFFRDEYRMNHRIATYPKPYIAFMDGIVLGGGMGVSVHGSFRVATERTRAGMPETAIGFTPDVGGSFHLARAPHHAGRHLALTSSHASGPEAVALRLADALVESERLPELAEALEEALTALGPAGPGPSGEAPAAEGLGAAAFETVERVIQRFAAPRDSRAAVLWSMRWMEDAYGRDTAVEALAALDELAQGEGDAAEGARAAAAAIREKSPTSVAVSFEALRRLQARGASYAMPVEEHERPESTGEMATVADALRQEFTVGVHLMRAPDMPEGIRALLVDKDRSPRWSPATLEEVRPEDVAAHFEPLPDVAPLELD